MLTLKKYFTLFNIFYQVILQQFTKVAAFPIIQMGEQRHKLTLQFSLHHWSADYSMHHVSWPQPSLEPRDSTSSLGKHFICSRWHSKYKWELGHGWCCGCTNVFALRICHLCPIRGKQSTSYTQSWQSPESVPKHWSDGGRKQHHYPSLEKKDPAIEHTER